MTATQSDAETTWKALIHKLGVWKHGVHRAVHKPLLTLLLLARAQRGESPVLAYSEIEPALRKSLFLFGRPTKQLHPEYPFWYLQNDGFWIVRDAAALPRRTGKDQPTHNALIERQATAEVPMSLWLALTDHPELIALLVRALLDEFWEESQHTAICSEIGLDLSPGREWTDRSPRDPAFRDAVLRAWSRRCAVCGYDGRLGNVPFGIEAAHIHSHCYHGPDVVQNGLALCSLHHKAFDFGAISIDASLRVLVSADVCGGDAVSDTLIRYANRPLVGLVKAEYRPAKVYIEWHADNVFHRPER
jgi:putative restriction endonuclease